MKKGARKTINRILNRIFRVLKNKHKRAKLVSLVSKTFVSSKNTVEYDEEFDMYWQKYDGNCLQIHEKPVFDFSYEKYSGRIDSMFCRQYDLKSGDVILDLGAGIGGELYFYDQRMNSSGKVYAIEASPDSYNKLNKLINKNNLPNIETFNIALSDKKGSVWIEETDAYKANQINEQKSGVEIPSMTFDDFIEENNIDRIDLFKVNIEGAEMQIIKGMDKHIQLIENFAISCHDFLFQEETHIRETVSEFFKSKGFEVSEINTGNKYIDSWIFGKRITN